MFSDFPAMFSDFSAMFSDFSAMFSDFPAMHTVPEFRSTQIYFERFFHYICSQRPQKIIKFGEDIVLTKVYVHTKFQYSMMYTRGDIQRKPLRINLGRVKFWNSVRSRAPKGELFQAHYPLH